MEKNNYDVIIVGGSYAGLSAALTLVRSLRSVLVIDNGRPCNRFAEKAYNLLLQDGAVIEDLARQARASLDAYEQLSFLDATAEQVYVKESTVEVVAGKEVYRAELLLLATGVIDVLPAIPGLEDCWGHSVLHCPYCHAYEFRGQHIGLLYTETHLPAMLTVLQNWTESITVFAHGVQVSPADMDLLQELGIKVCGPAISTLLHDQGRLQSVLCADNTNIAIDALFVRFPVRQHSNLASQAGCSLAAHGFIEVDSAQRSSVPRVYAAGDCCTISRSLSIAMGAGTLAAMCMNHELAERDLQRRRERKRTLGSADPEQQ